MKDFRAAGVVGNDSGFHPESAGSIPARRSPKRYDPPERDEQSLFELPPPSWEGEWETRIMDTPTAKRFLNEYHYLGGTHAMWSFGVFAPDLIAVVSIGQPANRNGVATKFDLQRWKGNHEITRVCVHPTAPANTASRVLRAACREYARLGYEWLFSYSDSGQGHHGGIYQAINAVYVGVSPSRDAWLLDGQPTHIRTLANRYKREGRALVEDLARHGMRLERVPGGRAAKYTYVVPIGRPSRRYAIRRHLRRYSLPYPKPTRRGRG